MKRGLAAAFLVACGQTGSILSLESPDDGGNPAPVDAALEVDVDGLHDGPADASSSSSPQDADSPSPPLAIVLANAAAPSHTLDPQIEGRLSVLGFAVEERPYTMAVTPADGAALVVVSSSAESAGLDPSLPDQPIPMVVLESFAYTKLGLAGPLQGQDFGVLDDTTVDVVDSALAGGLPVGPVKVYTQVATLNYAVPSASALVVARTQGDANPAGAAVFCYPAGATMVSRTAPAARAGVFLRTGTSTLATPEGWVLFDAVVRWTAK